MLQSLHKDVYKIETDCLDSIISFLIGYGFNPEAIKKMLIDQVGNHKSTEELSNEIDFSLKVLTNCPTVKDSCILKEDGLYLNVPEKRILFLDLDGVINILRPHKDHESVYLYEQKQEDSYIKEFAKNVEKLCKDFNFKIVISSSWRNHFNLDQLIYILRYMGITAPVLGTTIHSNNVSISLTRYAEIMLWVNKNKHDNYFILDDDPKAFSKDNSKFDGYLVPSEEGFNNHHYNECHKILSEKFSNSKVNIKLNGITK